MGKSSFMEKTTLEQRRMYRRTFAAKMKLKYAKLIRILGGKCAWCKRRGEPGAFLTIDHVQGKDYRARRLNVSYRISRYWKEYKAGVKLRVLCYECNSRDGRWRQLEGRVHAHTNKGPPF